MIARTSGGGAARNWLTDTSSGAATASSGVRRRCPSDKRSSCPHRSTDWLTIYHLVNNRRTEIAVNELGRVGAGAGGRVRRAAGLSRRSVSAGRAGGEHAAVGERHQAGVGVVRSVFRLRRVDGEMVANVHGLLPPAVFEQDLRPTELDAPLGDRARRVGH